MCSGNILTDFLECQELKQQQQQRKKKRKIPKTQNTFPIPYWFALCEDIPSTTGQA